jgi:hypothetical protein
MSPSSQMILAKCLSDQPMRDSCTNRQGDLSPPRPFDAELVRSIGPLTLAALSLEASGLAAEGASLPAIAEQLGLSLPLVAHLLAGRHLRGNLDFPSSAHTPSHSAVQIASEEPSRGC